MTATMAPAPTPTLGTPGGSAFGRLVHSEYLKIRTTNMWWMFALFTVLGTALALLVNMLVAHYYLTTTPGPDQAADFATQASAVGQAANLYTSGQFFGGLFVLLLAILVVTNEYYHQTATNTFLATPRRTSVVLAKFATAMIAAFVFWLIVTVIDLIAVPIFLSSQHVGGVYLGAWDVQRAILVNLMVFALWAVFGVGIGVLLRSQIAAMVITSLLYVIGSQIGPLIFFLIRHFLIKHDWVLSLQVLLPDQAAKVAVSVIPAFEHAPHAWVGVLVLLGYGILFGVVGTMIMRKRDIS